VSEPQEGLGVWFASAWLLGLSVVAWLLLGAARSAGGDPWISTIVQTALVMFVVAGIETLAVGLIPLRFMPGHPVYETRRKAWFAMFALAVLAYLLILVDPSSGYLSDNSRTPMIMGVAFLVGFGIVSIGTWVFFHFRPEHAGEDRPGEVPEIEGGDPGAQGALDAPMALTAEPATNLAAESDGHFAGRAGL
jgi:hypothetical protein